jgi:WD40 repeat protein
MNTAPTVEPTASRGIGGLIEDLRRAGFPVSTAEAIDATQLLFILLEREPEVAEDSRRLCARLRPVFCKTPEQQERFDAIFHTWARIEEPADLVGTGVTEEKRLPPPNKTSWLIIGIAFALLFVFLWITVSRLPTERVTDPLLKTFRPVRGPELPPSRPDTIGSVLGATRTEVLGYFPRLRYNRELRARWAWAFAALPLLTLVSLGTAVFFTRSRAGRRSEPMVLDRRELEEEARRIVPPLAPDIVARLARHLRGSPGGEARLRRRPILDLRATIEKTLRNRGIPSPQYRHTYAPPSYLLLVDVADQKSPRGRLFYQWAERLQRERLEVEIALVRLHEGQPQFLPVPRGESPRSDRRWMPLSRIPEPPFGQRLLLVSTGELLAGGDGRWRAQAVAARLHRWRQRAMFTPIEPRDWGEREDSIERSEHTADPGFLVLPLEESALGAWTHLLTTGLLTDIVLSEPQRLPGMLRREKGNDLLDNDRAPDTERLEKLIAQLQVYLGELGFQWLAALAIPPLVRWELTVLLGRDVIARLPTPVDPKKANAILVRHYRRLARLPWLRDEKTMPDWLRLRLLAELSPATQQRLRDVVQKLLGRLSPSSRGDGIELELERPPEPGARGPRRAGRDGADPLYAGYMSGMTPRQLAMVAPKEWEKWLSATRLPREPGLRGLRAAVANYLRSLWARWTFAGGLPTARLRLSPFVWTTFILWYGAVFLWLAATRERRWWPERLEELLFEERAHAIAFQHAAPLRAASFSPDGWRVVTASEDGTARVWDVKTGRALTPPLVHDRAITDAKFHPDGRSVFTASGTLVREWDAQTGKLVHDYPRGERVDNIHFDRTGSQVMAVGDNFGLLKLSLTGRPERPPLGTVNDGAFSADGRCVTVGANGVAQIWSKEGIGGPSLRQPAGVLRAAFNAVGDRVVTMGGNGVIRVWAAASGALMNEMTANARNFDLSPDGSEIVTAARDGTARVFGLRSAVPRLALTHGGRLISATFSSDGQRILTAGEDGTARVWDARTGRAIGPILRHQRALVSAMFTPDGLRILTASLDGSARIWEAVYDEPEVVPLRHRDLVTSVSFDKEGRRALTASFDGTAKIWDARTGVQIGSTLRHGERVWSAEFSPDGRSVLTGSSDSSAKLWDSWTGQRVRDFRPGGTVYRAAFSPDGRRIVTASVRGNSVVARIWDAQTGQSKLSVEKPEFVPPTATLMYFSDRPWADAQFAADGRHVLVSGLARDVAWILDSETGRLSGFGNDGRSTLYTVFNPDGSLAASFGRRLVTSGADSTARIWDVRNGALLRVLRHDRAVNQADFSPDGLRVVTASDDGTARIWSADQGELLAPPMRHRGPVTRVAFSDDGTRVITGTGPANDTIVDRLAADDGPPNEYAAPRDAAQIWRLPPPRRPDSSDAAVLRHRATRALEDASLNTISMLAALAIATLVLLPLIVALRRRRRIEELSEGRS